MNSVKKQGNSDNKSLLIQTSQEIFLQTLFQKLLIILSFGLQIMRASVFFNCRCYKANCIVRNCTNSKYKLVYLVLERCFCILGDLWFLYKLAQDLICSLSVQAIHKSINEVGVCLNKRTSQNLSYWRSYFIRKRFSTFLHCS